MCFVVEWLFFNTFPFCILIFTKIVSDILVPLFTISFRFLTVYTVFLTIRAGQSEEAPREVAPVAAAPQVTVIPGVDSLIGDLLDMDIGPPMTQQYHQSMGPPVGAVPSAGGMDLLGEGLDSLVSCGIFLLSACVSSTIHLVYLLISKCFLLLVFEVNNA